MGAAPQRSTWIITNGFVDLIWEWVKSNLWALPNWHALDISKLLLDRKDWLSDWATS